MKTENINTPNCIRTFSGQYVNVFDLKPDMIDILDIAHALSLQCRFGGHTQTFYSVAQHCVLTSRLVKEEHQLAALLHDASEAYIIDIPSPIKKNLIEYKVLENKVMLAVSDKYGFDYPLDDSIKQADEEMLMKEWYEKVLKDTLPSWTSFEAKKVFLEVFAELKAKGY